MMSWEFIEEVIRTGIEGAKESYGDDPEKLAGSIAGFEACRGKTPEEIAKLLGVAAVNTRRAYAEDLPDYWRHRCFEAEIHWVCNCLSAVLVNEGIAPIVEPTARAVMHANRILSGGTK